MQGFDTYTRTIANGTQTASIHYDETQLPRERWVATVYYEQAPVYVRTYLSRHQARTLLRNLNFTPIK